MSGLRVTNLRGETAGTSPKFPDGVVVTGVTTSTSFSGGLTGNVTGNVTGNISGTTGAFTGAVSGATGSFTGNVSVGGTLTYEDVTNVDSVGVITARSGIKIGAGQSVSAVSGTITYYGDGSKLSGIEVGTSDFVGFGTGITAGVPVIVRSDGKISAVEGSGIPDPPTVGADTQFESGAAIRMASVYHAAEGKTIIAYADYGDSSKGKAVALTVTGGSTNTVASGSAYEFEDGDTRFLSLAYDPDTERIIAHYANNNDNNYAYTNVGSVNSSSQITWGTAARYYSAGMGHQSSAVYDTTNNKIVLIWPNGDSNLRSVTGTVNGSSTNTLTLGSTEEIASSTNVDYTSALFHSGVEKTVVFYQNASQSNKGYYAVGTGSGSNSQTWALGGEFTSTGISNIGSVYDSYNQRVVVAYRDTGNSNHGYARVGTLAGVGNTVMSWGTAVPFNDNGDTDHIRMAFDSSTNKIIISFVDANNSGEVSVKTGNVVAADNSIAFSSTVDVSTASGNQTVVSYDSTNERVVVGYNQGNLSGTGRARVVQSTTSVQSNLTTENYVGLAAAGISSGSTGSVTLPGGINSNQSGLTTGRTYYVGNGGNLQLSASSPSVIAGTSISSTQILVR